MEEDQRNITVSIRFTDLKGTPRLKRMNKQDRLDFVDWMFDHSDKFQSGKTPRSKAKLITENYKTETSMLLNPDWVNNLLRAGICKLSDGTYGFEREDIPYSIEQVCEHPTLFKNIEW